jgi:hypothetical protein
MIDNIQKATEITEIQCTEGNWDYDSYMFGMANGMILVLATVKGEEPKFLSAPEVWGRDAEGSHRVKIGSVDDGRPCPTDLFLVHIEAHETDHYDYRARVKDWIEGDWEAALADLPPLEII